MATFRKGDEVRWGDGFAEVVKVERERVVCRTAEGLERITTVESLAAHQPVDVRRGPGSRRSLLGPKDGAA